MSYDDLLDLLRRRRSPYAFDGRAVSDDDLARVFEAARWAPSSRNEQPWRFVVGRRGDAAYQAILAALTGRNPTWARTAPVLGLGLVARTFARGGADNRHRRHDLGAAGLALSLAAATRGLGLHQMAGVEGGAAAEAFGVPDAFEVVVAFALGHPAPDPAALVPADLAARASSPKPRRPLGETVFGPAWAEPLLSPSADSAPPERDGS
ncbi:nitroreductase family protein [Rubrivirga litoralis]|uniref:Nitroreductase family protein n=1 Tax=Rubrivirga litoralis TaxID=3075598 RepID=A0ABU3BS38_9BACT|nr:nitroreductase family protein [Rubrivirga sp. F394]MDT0632114.1 nitroreductase family protein [Rubrivirga sp. F394]